MGTPLRTLVFDIGGGVRDGKTLKAIAVRTCFQREASFCVLCVRYCDEVKKKNAVSFFDNGSVRQIKFGLR